MSNPANMLPPKYDDYHSSAYDPEYTADISKRMRVPEKIEVTNITGKRKLDQNQEDLKRAAEMQIPDRILMSGNDYEGRPDLMLDLEAASQHAGHLYVELQTPPRVLTLEDDFFPAPDYTGEEDSDHETDKLQNPALMNGHVGSTTPRRHSDSLEREAKCATPGGGLLINDDGEDGMDVLRRQVRKLSRHVMRLEEENTKRSQREMFLYPMMVGYILFQVAKWFLRNS